MSDTRKHTHQNEKELRTPWLLIRSALRGGINRKDIHVFSPQSARARARTLLAAFL